MSKSYLLSSQEEDFIEGEINKIISRLNIQKGSADYFEIIPSKNKQSIGIDSTKKLKEWLTVKPFNSPNKIAIIRKADLLTTEAQNSILKQLEEPNPNSYIVLVVENPRSLLPTVLSRCELILDYRFSKEETFYQFVNLSKKEQFLLIENILTDKDPLILKNNVNKLLHDILLELEIALFERPFDKKLRANIDLVEQTYIMISANTSKRLALENLIINMK